MVSIYPGKASLAAIAFFIMLFTAQAHAQRERLQTPDPINEFNLLEKQLFTGNDSLIRIYPLVDSIDIYSITFSTLGRDFKGYYILPKHSNHLPVILYNLSKEVDELHFDHVAAIKFASNAPRGHGFIISSYYDPNNPPGIGTDSCKERNVITNMMDHLSLFPGIDATRVIVKEIPNP